MFSNVLLLLCFIQFARAGVWFHVGQASIGAKGNSYHEMVYNGESSFVGAVKLVHTKGYVTNAVRYVTGSFWGSNDGKPLATLITDTQNRIIYPSPRVIQVVANKGWYEMPGYTGNSSNLVFSDFCAPQYFEKGRKLRVWYGEDLYDYTEVDNRGTAYMEVYFYLSGNLIAYN